MSHRNPSFYSQVPPYLLYLCMMGKGGVYRFSDGIIMKVAISSNLLPCGCAGMDHYRLVNERGEKVLEKLTHEEYETYAGKALESISFQEKEFEAFWESFYQTNPSLKPLTLRT